MKICLDAGHGGYDSGACGCGLKEKDITLKIVLAMRDILVSKGHEVKLTRDDDNSPSGITNTSQELMERCRIANEFGADLFCSVHINSAENSAACGGEVYYYSHGGEGIALRCQREQLAVMGNSNRGIKTAGFAVIKYTNMPAVLCESGFICNPIEAAKYKDDSIIVALAKGYCEALLNTTIETTPTYVQKASVVYVDPQVKQLQHNLNVILKAGLAEDGSYGPCTKAAVIKFQEIVGLEQDGSAGPLTNGAIGAILSKPLCKRGSTGIPVRFIQYKVGAGIDGSFGPNTLIYVQNFQSRNGLVADGCVGPCTWSKLL